MKVGMRPPVAVHFGSAKSPLEQKAERLGGFLKANGFKDLNVELMGPMFLVTGIQGADWSRIQKVLAERPENKDRHYYLPTFEGTPVGISPGRPEKP